MHVTTLSLTTLTITTITTLTLTTTLLTLTTTLTLTLEPIQVILAPFFLITGTTTRQLRPLPFMPSPDTSSAALVGLPSLG